MKKWQRNLTLIVLVLVGIFALLSFTAYTKQGMSTVVRLWENQLTSYAEALISEGGSEAYLPEKAKGFGYRIDVCPLSQCVFFKHNTFKETGFFYSASGNPVGYLGQDVTFEKKGNGWLWNEGASSDNWFYAEHIVGNWYWYEMHY